MFIYTLIYCLSRVRYIYKSGEEERTYWNNIERRTYEKLSESDIMDHR